jgi:hypothetical protein
MNLEKTLLENSMILFAAADELRGTSFVPANSDSQTFHCRAADTSANHDRSAPLVCRPSKNKLVGRGGNVRR